MIGIQRIFKDRGNQDHLRLYRHSPAWAALLTSLLLAGCSQASSFINTPSALSPAGPVAARIAGLWWVFFGLRTVIYVGVMIFLLAALWRRRGSDLIPTDESRDSRKVILLGGLVMPAVILVILFGLTVGTTAALSPSGEAAVTMEVTGRQWWWQVHYPTLQFSTANEIHTPAGRPVEIKLRSEDIIHSFWVPQLHGKLDLNPGDINMIWIEADEPNSISGPAT